MFVEVTTASDTCEGSGGPGVVGLESDSDFAEPVDLRWRKGERSLIFSERDLVDGAALISSARLWVFSFGTGGERGLNIFPRNEDLLDLFGFGFGFGFPWSWPLMFVGIGYQVPSGGDSESINSERKAQYLSQAVIVYSLLGYLSSGGGGDDGDGG